MKKLLTKENIRGVVQSLVASILFIILLEPAIEIGKNFGKGIISSFVNYFYYSCARENGITFMSYLALAALLWFVSLLILFFCSVDSLLTTMEKTYKDTQIAEDNIGSPKPEEDVKEINLKGDKPEKQKLRSKRRLRFTTRISIIFLILFFCNVFIYKFCPTIANETFNRRIIQITPYVETSEINLLKSEWVSMESKDDYERITEKIDNILSINELK